MERLVWKKGEPPKEPDPLEKINTNRQTNVSLSEKEYSYKSSKSISELFDDNFYDILEVIGQEKVIHQDPVNVEKRRSNDLFHTHRDPILSNSP